MSCPPKLWPNIINGCDSGGVFEEGIRVPEFDPCFERDRDLVSLWQLKKGILNVPTWKPAKSETEQTIPEAKIVEQFSVLEQFKQIFSKETFQFPDWSWEETLEMLDWVDVIGEVFPIIMDRWKTNNGRKDLLDVKDHYYRIIKAMRPGEDLPAYHKESEHLHRLELERFEREQSTDLIREERYLAEMMSNVSLNLAAIKAERERALVTIGGLGEQLASHAPTMPQFLGISLGAEKKSTSSRSTTSNQQSTSQKSQKAQSSSSRKRGTKRSLQAGDLELSDKKSVGRKPKPAQCNTIAKSSLTKHTLRVGLTRKVDKALFEMGFLKSGPTIATDAVCAKFEELRELLARLYDTGGDSKSANASFSASRNQSRSISDTSSPNKNGAGPSIKPVQLSITQERTA